MVFQSGGGLGVTYACDRKRLSTRLAQQLFATLQFAMNNPSDVMKVVIRGE